MRFTIEIEQGAIVPRGYGVAWPVLDRATVICMPVPLNVIACWLRVVWRWLRFPPGRHVGLKQIYEAESRAFARGRQAAEGEFQFEREEQYRRGYDAGKRDTHALVMTLLEVKQEIADIRREVD
jgi:hypothetical protein